MTRNLDSLKSLQARIRDAKGADRSLDAEVCAVFRYAPGTTALREWVLKYPEWIGRSDGRVQMEKDGPHFQSPKFTTDPDGLGACVALKDEVLPGHRWERDWNGAITLLTLEYRCVAVSEPLATDCLTFIDAILSSVIAEEEAKQERVS